MEQISQRGRHDQHGPPGKGAFEPPMCRTQDTNQPETVELELVGDQQQESCKPPQARRHRNEEKGNKPREADSLQHSPIRPGGSESPDIFQHSKKSPHANESKVPEQEMLDRPAPAVSGQPGSERRAKCKPDGRNKHRRDDVDDGESYVGGMLQPRWNNVGTDQIVGQHHEQDGKPSELVYGLQSLPCVAHLILPYAQEHGHIPQKLKSASMKGMR